MNYENVRANCVTKISAILFHGKWHIKWILWQNWISRIEYMVKVEWFISSRRYMECLHPRKWMAYCWTIMVRWTKLVTHENGKRARVECVSMCARDTNATANSQQTREGGGGEGEGEIKRCWKSESFTRFTRLCALLSVWDNAVSIYSNVYTLMALVHRISNWRSLTHTKLLENMLLHIIALLLLVCCCCCLFFFFSCRHSNWAFGMSLAFRWNIMRFGCCLVFVCLR